VCAPSSRTFGNRLVRCLLRRCEGRWYLEWLHQVRALYLLQVLGVLLGAHMLPVGAAGGAGRHVHTQSLVIAIARTRTHTAIASAHALPRAMRTCLRPAPCAHLPAARNAHLPACLRATPRASALIAPAAACVPSGNLSRNASCAHTCTQRIAALGGRVMVSPRPLQALRQLQEQDSWQLAPVPADNWHAQPVQQQRQQGSGGGGGNSGSGGGGRSVSGIEEDAGTSGSSSSSGSLRVPFDLVVNCSGLGARALMQDTKVDPIRGQVRTQLCIYPRIRACVLFCVCACVCLYACLCARVCSMFKAARYQRGNSIQRVSGNVSVCVCVLVFIQKE